MRALRKIIGQNPLFFGFFFPALIDGILTLLGQSPAYWRGEGSVNEASPAYYFLSVSPWLFVLGGVVWFIFWYFIFKRLKEPLVLFLMFLFITAHSWGSSSWILMMLHDKSLYTIGNQGSIMFAWSLTITYFGFVAAIATYCTKVYLDQRR